MNLKASVKTRIRRVTRGLGYDLVPLGAGITRVQREVLEQTPVAVDVGANVGQYAERLRDIGFEGRIISFEPGSEAFETLASKAARHGEKWDARKVALGDRTGQAVLKLSGNSVSSSLLEVAEEHLRAAPASEVVAQEEVPLSTLDEQLRDVPEAPFWIKIDTQGFELPVLRGATETLARTVGVQVEISFTHLYDGQTDWLDLCRYLQDAGFVVRYLEPGYEDKQSGYMLQADVVFVRQTR